MILIIIFFLVSLFCLWYAGYCNAVMDAVKHYPVASIFNDTSKIGTENRFGILYEYYWNLNSKDYDSKYNYYDKAFGKRKTKILFFKIHMVQFYDAWHNYKMRNIGFNIIADVSASVMAVMIQSKFNPIIGMWVVLAFIYFIIQAVNWNVLSFNPAYDKWLRKK